MHRHGFLIPLVTIGLAVGATACGSDADDASVPATAVTATAAASTTPAATAPSAATTPIAATTTSATTIASTTVPTTVAPAPLAVARQIDFTMADYSYAGLPDSLPSGAVRLRATNQGHEEHQATFLRINDDKSLGDVLGALAAAPQTGYPLVRFAGGPQSVSPGEAQSAVVDLRPGHYVVMCFIPGKDGVPHVAKGMLKEVTVTDSGVASAPPVPAGDTIVLSDYAYQLPTKLVGGTTVRVLNHGTQPHEVAAYRVADGVDPNDAIAALTAPAGAPAPVGPPPVTPAGGITIIQPDTVAGIDLTWKPGNYVVLCFVPDAKDGTPHFAKGMVAKVTVTG